MSKIMHALAGLGAAAVLTLTPVASFADTVIGIYQSEDRLSDYQLNLCGQDDKFLCVKLLALRGSAKSAEGDKMLGTNVVNLAKPVGQNKWKGKLVLVGKTADSTLTLNRGVALGVHACAYIVVCADISLPVAK